ncbi:DDB1- and CUL4-associated factor 4 [Telopea speciosissima]|uniref:DDB1- and CUL4-associated factor 4 n=1 Tax=Telopea speciosissima TaxID=54955 RepID=UPI001CC420DC|nr:DDB1- and CUL4-associated factor 4 [Telopea speciosissima]
MPQELPGYYYDPEKNRYFLLKGPIPGSTRNSSAATASSSNIDKPNQVSEKLNIARKKGKTTAKLIHARELYGKVLTFNKRKCNFQQEYVKIQVSKPTVWKYQNTDRIADGALEQLHINLQTLEGENEADVLVTGSMNGCLSLFEVGKVGQHSDYGVKCMPDRVWPLTTENQAECSKVQGDIWRPTGASALLDGISCIKRIGKHSSPIQHVLIATLGSETLGGALYDLNLETLDFNPRTSILRRISLVAPLNCTIWTADCNSSGTQAIVGTNLGAALVNLETGVQSWVCRSKSDVLSQQFDHSGNVVLCGLRNGAIVTVDVRQRQQGLSARLPKHRVPYPSYKTQQSSRKNVKNLTHQCFELKGNIDPSCTIFMPSSISSLVYLQSYDQYFLASSMDGLIKLYDHRMIQRGAVQLYEGHVNSHSRIQLGVDPSESFVISGGENGNVCIWSIKSGQLLFGTKISNSVPSTVCCAELHGLPDGRNNSWGTWLGSHEGLYFMGLNLS